MFFESVINSNDYFEWFYGVREERKLYAVIHINFIYINYVLYQTGVILLYSL